MVTITGILKTITRNWKHIFLVIMAGSIPVLYSLHELFPESNIWNGNILPGDFYTNWKIYIFTVTFTGLPVLICAVLLITTNINWNNFSRIIFLGTVFMFSSIKLYDSFRRVNQFLMLNDYNTRIFIPIACLLLIVGIAYVFTKSPETKLEKLQKTINNLTENELNTLIHESEKLQLLLGNTGEFPNDEVARYSGNQVATALGEEVENLKNKLNNQNNEGGRQQQPKTNSARRSTSDLRNSATTSKL